MMYCGGGFVTSGAVDYIDGEDVIEDYDVYDAAFDLPRPDILPPKKERRPRQMELGGEGVSRKEDSPREYPQFAKKYDGPIDTEKLKEALGWATGQASSLGTFRYDDIYDRRGEVAGVAFWVGFGPDVTAGAIHDALYEAFKQAGADVAQTLIGMGNLRRGIERQGGTIKQSFFRIFVPHEGWKLLSDWTILREGETKADVRPELQTMVRERQKVRRLEIIEALKDIRVAEVHAAQLAEERALREAAEERARELARELERQDRAIRAAAAAAAQGAAVVPPKGWRDAVERAMAHVDAPPGPVALSPESLREAVEDAARRAAEAAAERARQKPVRAPVAPTVAPPKGWREAAARAAAERAERPVSPAPAPAPAPMPKPEPLQRPRAAPSVPKRADAERPRPAPAPRPAPTPTRPRPTKEERAEARRVEARRLSRRARYLLDKYAPQSRTREANAGRREARELLERAAKLRG